MIDRRRPYIKVRRLTDFKIKAEKRYPYMIFFFIILYGLLLGAGDLLAHLSPIVPLLTALGVLVYCRLMLAWVKRSGQSAEIGLVLPDIKGAGDCALLLPLLLLPVLNIFLFGLTLPTLSSVLLMFGVSVAEEVFFRGFLLRFLGSLGRYGAPLMASFFFGLFHFINLAGGADPVYTVLQAFCAFGTGLAFCGVRRRFKSLVPSIAAHFLINLTGAASSVSAAVSGSLLICGGIMAVYGLWLCGEKQ